MVYCAAFGCNNQSKKGNGLHFFSFPKDSNLRKAWTHYCKRWNFVPGNSHRLCSAHFSRDCFDRDPLRMVQLGVHGTINARLKTDAIPDVPLQSADEKKDGDNSLHIPRGALQKRQKAEVCICFHYFVKLGWLSDL